MNDTFYAMLYADTGEYVAKHSVLSTRTRSVGKARVFPSEGIAKMSVPLVHQWFESRGYVVPEMVIVPMEAHRTDIVKETDRFYEE